MVKKKTTPKRYLQLLDDKCPRCGKRLAVWSRHSDGGKFIGCSSFPDTQCRYAKRKSDVDFVREELGIPIEWRPNIDNSLLGIFSQCQSSKEKLYLLGAIYYLEGADFEYSLIKYQATRYYGLIFNKVFPYLKMGGYTPTSVAIVPQVEFRDEIRAYHHDFGIFYSMEKYPKEDEWKLELAVEIDYHYLHKLKPGKDKYRDSIVKYKVLRLDEKDDPKNWFYKFESVYNSNFES